MNCFAVRLVLPLACLGLFVLVGCSDEAQAPPRFKLDADKAAQDAMAAYDKNGDGTLDRKELAASPALADLLENLKKNQPGHGDSLTKDDIAGRLHQWLEEPTTLISFSPRVMLDGKPLADATVTLEPEAFLGTSYRTHEGTTNASGVAFLVPEFPNYLGIYVGLYRVRISKKVGGKEILPANYNTATELGCEVANGARDPRSNGVFALTSK